MELTRSFQALHEGTIFIGGAVDAAQMVREEGCKVILDLRAESSEPSVVDAEIAYIHIPIEDGTEGQEELLKKAIYTVIEASDEGKKVGFHCTDGHSRAGSVAIGILIALGLAENIEAAAREVKNIRPDADVHPLLKASLSKIQSDRKTFILDSARVGAKKYESVADLIRDRRSVWDFKPDSIPVDKINELLNTAVWAPTHGLREPWRFILVQGDGRKKFAKAVVKTYSKEDKVKYEKSVTNYYTGVPCHLIVAMRQDPRQNHYDEDFAATSCLIMNLQLAAWEQGIGLVWKTNPYIYAPSFREAFGVDPGEKIVGVLHMGYPSKIYKPRRRTNAEEKLTIVDTLS